MTSYSESNLLPVMMGMLGQKMELKVDSPAAESHCQRLLGDSRRQARVNPAASMAAVSDV